MATQTLTIDCQVHCYERNTPARPWNGHLEGPEQVTGDDMVVAMDAVGVDGAILISPFSLYGYDPSYCQEQYAKHPTKFGLVRPFNPDSDSVDEDVAEWTSTTGVVGCRVMLGAFEGDADHAGMNRIFAACARAGVPVNVMAAGKLPLLKELARAQPGHLGDNRPPRPGPALRSTPSGRALRRPAQRAIAGRAGQRGHQDFRGRNPGPRAVPLLPTSGNHSAASSTPTASTAASGAPTGPAPCGCSPTSRASRLSASTSACRIPTAPP